MLILPWRPLIAVIACLSVFDVSLGLTYPLLALVLEARGVDATMIGLNAAMTPVGLVLFAPFIPAVARRMGTRVFVLACIGATGVILTLFKAIDDLAIWFALRFLLGVAEAGLFTVSEAWINELAGRAHRGRVVAIYASLLSAGFAVGPFLLAIVGSEGWTPFLVGLAFIVAGALPLILLRDGLPKLPTEDHGSLRTFLPFAPVLLAAVLVFAIFDTGIMSLFPIYGLRNGLDETVAASALGLLIAGNILLQFPIGWLSDRTSRRAVMIGCAMLTVAGGLLLPVVLQTWLLWPLLFLWGSAAFGVYTMALAELGDRFSGAVLLAGSAAFAAAWGLGGIIGPPLGGVAMEGFGPDGLPFSLAVCFLVFAGFAFLRMRKSRQSDS